MRIEAIDHLVLTVRSIADSAAFYRLLGMKEIRFGENRTALVFGSQKINLHEAEREFEPKAGYPTPGSADLCFICSTPVTEAAAFLRAQGVAVLSGPVERDGAAGRICSIYIRDPDQNLIELSNPLDK